MAKQFNGTINLDIRDSKPDWEPYQPPTAKEGAPNVLYIVWDDTGIAAWDVFGGLIEMPNMKRIADMGLRYTQLAHHRALLADTLLPADGAQRPHERHGLHHRGRQRLPRLERRSFRRRTARSPRCSSSSGYNTYCVGKWHLTPATESQHGRFQAELAAGPGVRAILRLPRRRDQPVVPGSGL